MTRFRSGKGARRRGFTIVELLVALALVIFIMSILSEAFVAAIDSFLTLKAIGDLDAGMRTVATILRNDLAADHFVSTTTSGAVALSQIQLSTTSTSTPPLGFFRIYQGTPPVPIASATPASLYVDEGTDPDGIHSYRAVNHMLHFSVNFGAPSPTGINSADLNRLPSFLSAVVPANVPIGNPVADYSPPAYMDPNGVTMYSQWAEVAWFLRSNGTTANGTPLFNLYRRQMALVPNAAIASLDSSTPTATTCVSAAAPAPGPPYYPPSTGYPEVSCIADPTTARAGYIYFNSNTQSLPDISAPIMRFGMYHPGAGPVTNQNAGILSATDPVLGTNAAYPIFSDTAGVQSTLWGRDLVLTNVVSFDVKLSLGNGTGTAPTSPLSSWSDQLNAGFMDLYDARLAASVVSNPAFSQSTGPMVFDTWCTTSNPNAWPGSGYYNYTAWATAGADTTIPMTPPLIQALQIIIRVWDPRTETTRQMTIIQNM